MWQQKEDRDRRHTGKGRLSRALPFLGTQPLQAPYFTLSTSLLAEKRQELLDQANKLRTGLFKIDETREKVEVMSLELEDAKKKVAEFQKQCEEYLVIIVQQKREADEQQKVGGSTVVLSLMPPTTSTYWAEAYWPPSVTVSGDAHSILNFL